MPADHGAVQSAPEGSSRHAISNGLGVVAVAFLVSRFFVCGVVFLSRLEIIRGPFWQPGKWFNVFTHVDAAAYLDAARRGLFLSGSHTDPSSAFFPLYPLLVRLAAFLVGDIAVAGVAIANLSLFAAGLLLYRLVQHEFADLRVSRMAVMFLMFSPASFFLSSALPDSTLLLLLLGAMLAAQRQRWAMAAICAILASATMNLGFLVIVGLAVEVFLQSRRAGGGMGWLLKSKAWLFAISAIQLGAVIWIGASRFSDPLALLRFGADSVKAFAALVTTSVMFVSYSSFYEPLFIGVVTTAIVFCVAGWYLRLPRSWLVYSGAVIAACIVSHDLESARTLVLAFPLFGSMALVARRFEWASTPMLAGTMTLLALCTIVAANGFWLT